MREMRLSPDDWDDFDYEDEHVEFEAEVSEFRKEGEDENVFSENDPLMRPDPNASPETAIPVGGIVVERTIEVVSVSQPASAPAPPKKPVKAAKESARPVTAKVAEPAKKAAPAKAPAGGKK